MDEKTRIFQQYRNDLLNIAYSMLGSLATAEDIVQDAFLRWNEVSLEQIDRPGAYLKKMTSRLCLDELKSARVRRETYTGPWLPEPVVTSGEIAPDRRVELNEQLSLAMLHLLESLSADQRAIYLLHDLFDFTFREVADIVEKSPAACRKAAQRARETLAETHSGNAELPSSVASDRKVDRFIEALRRRDMDELKDLLTGDAVVYSDGGGEVTAARKPIAGREHVSRFLFGISDQDDLDIEIRRVDINHRPGYLAYIDGSLHSIWSFRIERNGISDIYAVLNPGKLSRYTDQSLP